MDFFSRNFPRYRNVPTVLVVGGGDGVGGLFKTAVSVGQVMPGDFLTSAITPDFDMAGIALLCRL